MKACFYNKNRIMVLALTVLQILFSFYGDSIIFAPERYYLKPIYVVAKLFACLFMALFWKYVTYLIVEIRQKNENARIFVIHFLIYFGIMICFLILTWPGIWRADEANILGTVVNLRFNYWHHWLTDMYYIICLCILPFPSGIVIIQLFLISVIIAFFLTNMKYILKSKWYIVCYLPFFLPTIIDNNLYPLRASVITYLELLFVFIIFKAWINREELKLEKVVLLATLIAIIGMWRTEGVYYFVLGPILIFVMLRKKIKIQLIAGMVMMSFLLGAIINYVQSTQPTSSTYSLSILQGHLGTLIENNYRTDTLEEDMEIIYAVFPEKCGTNFGYGVYCLLIDNVEANDDKFDEKVNALLKLYVRMIIQNPDIFMKDVLKIFVEANGLVPNSNTMCADTTAAFDGGYTAGTLMDNPYGTYHLYLPWNNNLRSKTIRFLECRDLNEYIHTTVVYSVFYNAIPSMLILFVFIILGMIRKKKELFFIGAFLLARSIIVMLASPCSYFMYYIPTYLCGYVMLIVYILMKKFYNQEVKIDKN